MILIVYVVLLLGINHVESEELPTIFEVENSINRTIDQVERLINENPNLPRLSRNDIVDILYNITSKDSEAYENKDQIEKARKMYQRALMVVLPYKARESLENLKDLYTKAPIVQMLSDSASGERLEMVLNDRSKESNSESSESTDNILDKSRYKNHREIYSDVRSKESLKETLTPGSAPMRFSFNLDSLQTNHHYPTRETTRIDDHPIFLPTTRKTINDDQVEDINVVLDKETSSSEELAIDLGPKQDILYSNQWHYNAPPPQSIPNESKEEFSFGEIQQEEKESSKIFVTPLALTSQTSKYNTTLALNSGGFRDATSTTERISTEPTTKLRVMDLLASIGLRPENEENLDNVFPINQSNVSYENGIVSLDADKPDSPLIENQNTFRTGSFDLNKGMENLTPDLRLLFQRFGFESTQDRQSPSITTTTRTTTNLYRNFKPLPTSTVQDEEMKEFLSRFGLGVNRQRKAMKSTVPSVIEAVPINMRTVLQNIGLISNSRRNSKNSLHYSEETKTTPKYHVFKPHETIFKNDNERSKINELLDTVKLVQEGKADTKDVEKVASDLLKNTRTLSVGPDPLSLDEIIRVYSEDLKNEVKRQKDDAQSSTSEGNSPTSTTISSIETTTLMDSAKEAAGLNETTATTESEPMLTTTTTTATTITNTNLIDLENSFGGSTRAPDPVLPARRKTGLYFLVDWNTFLEVGEEGSEKINLRFQPKVGDRSRFLPVTVP
ncbi:PREDICTED: uncharacterized protein LOC106786504 isoform X2 [Polistes canadensis]|uniref:uncharacterized protein LOC106786504 isoform X1 n=1 Tax=Polistes canadensis TaxID=91411 RepID=UPI000718B741|nr:PREDICTED: uncharacterized protein LOC106786504 isoform X1 [Polistes canadensis]XP_014603455.1 PREDICTED: uncharacterized protein LOC106786504 isoform X2 [Polistes canadensis]